ncbi:uncharacterized protein LOC124935169 [Impatiens glandulifera]|uniref:uncharacterized protein LOC124935169 n=1 Tax=Impatiens glandulifera TaxID=253017 RepID=UPI001FB14CEF|nr:uncharacterized protein LOC124935169 [Impatiens glandulifera]
MKPVENMKEFSDRFTSVVNELYTLGKIYDNKEIIVKALRSLPSAWDIKTMVMRESSNLGQMKVHDVFEDLKAYEFEMKSRIEDEASISTVTRALMTSVEQTAPVSSDPAPIKNPDQICDDVMTMLAKKFGRFMKKNQPSNNQNYNYDYSDKSYVKCYNYNALGHYRSKCRRPRRDDRKPENNYQRGDNQQNGEGNETKKVLITSDGGSEWAYSDSDEERVTCFMAKEEEVPNFQEEFDFSSEEFTKEDLVIALNDMVAEFKNLSTILPIRSNVEIRESSGTISKPSGTKTYEPIELSCENEKLKEKVQSLTKENERTKYVMDVWKKSSEAVSQMSTYQRHPKCMFGLGYKGSKLANQKSSNGMKLNKGNLSFVRFVKSSSTDNGADHDSKADKEIKYVGPTDSDK